MEKLNKITNLRNLLKFLLSIWGVMWYYLSYPIRYRLRYKVERYKNELEKIRWRQQYINPKTRRYGRSESIANMMIHELFLSIKYDRFIKRWSL